MEEIIKYQIKNLKVKNTMSVIKFALDAINRKLDTTEEKVSEFNHIKTCLHLKWNPGKKVTNEVFVSWGIVLSSLVQG